jgi:DNA-binding PadR family transcriptional regulator
LVVLGLLYEAPMHGYQVVRELERRDVADWAGISRPQVYYSFKKLVALQLIRPVKTGEPAAGPEKRVCAPTAAARTAMTRALEREHWMTQRPPPPFVTWLVLTVHATRSVVAKGLRRRRRFLTAQVEKERLTLKAIRQDRGPTVAIGAAVVSHAIAQFELELRWLDGLERTLR